METRGPRMHISCSGQLETKYRDIADSKQVYWWNQAALLSCHQALYLLQMFRAIHCAYSDKSRLARKLGFLFSPRQHAQILVEFGTDTGSISRVLIWHKSRQDVKSNAQQVYWQPRQHQHLPRHHFHRPVETGTTYGEIGDKLVFL